MPNIEFKIPSRYLSISPEQVYSRITALKEKLGDELVILAHHYQRDEVYQFADFTGDSLKLSQKAAQTPSAKYIVFCGVHFMAETADILTGSNQIVTLPDMRAGCPMADMAPIKRVEKLWGKLNAASKEETLPITYINSSAELKAFCADKNGTVCTSTNAGKILEWALKQNKKILFLPDRHLGGNIARQMKISPEEIITVTPKTTAEEINRSKILLWQGHCPVHNKFSKEAVFEAKKKRPNIKLIAHPECPQEVFELADATGSTEQIIKQVEASEPGSEWLIATETHLVGRLKKQHPDKHIEILSTPSCMCSMMDRISPAHLLWNLEQIDKGEIVNQIKVPTVIAEKARKGLEIMLQLS